MRALIAVVVLSTLVGCETLHPILNTLQPESQKSNRRFVEMIAPDPTKLESEAVQTCRDRITSARRSANWKEGLGFTFGFLGLGAGAVSGAEVGGDWSNLGKGLWGMGIGLSAVGAAIGVYLLSSASYDRQGAATLDAAVVQMQQVDGWFKTADATMDGFDAEGRLKKQEAVKRVQWQTCAKAIAAWAQGAGNADSTVASIFGAGAGTVKNGKGER